MNFSPAIHIDAPVLSRASAVLDLRPAQSCEPSMASVMCGRLEFAHVARETFTATPSITAAGVSFGANSTVQVSEAMLTAIKGDRGEQGEKGDPGDSLMYWTSANW